MLRPPKKRKRSRSRRRRRSPSAESRESEKPLRKPAAAVKATPDNIPVGWLAHMLQRRDRERAGSRSLQFKAYSPVPAFDMPREEPEMEEDPMYVYQACMQFFAEISDVWEYKPKKIKKKDLKLMAQMAEENGYDSEYQQWAMAQWQAAWSYGSPAGASASPVPSSGVKVVDDDDL
mmetsp:Transcript_64373/g.172328  ORF Transcript_64373/g.172328 Transcript_64373/m.172328 type:complete len:176 (-) Transcript_64373:72-599(-)